MKAERFLKTVATLLAFASVFASAQTLQSAAGANVTLTATLADTLSVQLDASNVNFALTAKSAINPGDASIHATTSWVLNEGCNAVKLYAYFDDPTAALTAGAMQRIPSSNISAKVSGDSIGSFNATASSFSAGAGLTIFSQAITNENRNSRRVSPVTLNIDLSGLPDLPVGAYTGTLHFRAEANI